MIEKRDKEPGPGQALLSPRPALPGLSLEALSHKNKGLLGKDHPGLRPKSGVRVDPEEIGVLFSLSKGNLGPVM